MQVSCDTNKTLIFSSSYPHNMSSNPTPGATPPERGRGRPRLSLKMRKQNKANYERARRKKKRVEATNRVLQEFQPEQPVQVTQHVEAQPRYSLPSNHSARRSESPEPSRVLPLGHPSPQPKEPSPVLQPQVAIASSPTAGYLLRYSQREEAQRQHEGELTSITSWLQNVDMESS